jgi:hypothetical protein
LNHKDLSSVKVDLMIVRDMKVKNLKSEISNLHSEIKKYFIKLEYFPFFKTFK